jgi:hypothetical protein
MKRSELRNLIRALGGPKVVGRVIGCSSSAVSHWDQVPREHILVIESMARERKVLRSNGDPYSATVLRPDVQDALDRIESSPSGTGTTLVQEV